MFEATSAWKSAYPEAHAGVLVMRAVSNPAHHPALESRKAALEEQLRSQFSDQDRATIASHPILRAYGEYYRQFKKTYHIQLQLESIVLKGKSIPSMAALVEAMFMAEMKDLLLTAGHDLDVLHLPLTLDVATGTERYNLLRGEEQTLKAGDMMISDQVGVISSIVHGPDQRTQITPETRNVIFTVYAPTGISEQSVAQHRKPRSNCSKFMELNNMILISVNLGEKRIQQRKDHIETTGIFKFPTDKSVKVTKLGLEGDVIVSKKHHGGPDQAVYVYGLADYAWWARELGREISPGTFGENLTISELESASFNVGDMLHISDVTLQISAPRAWMTRNG